MKCANHNELVEVAKKYSEKIADCTEAQSFLNYISEGKGYACGHKGALLTWGIVGNYTDADDFIKKLEPFFLEIYDKECGPLDFEHILVFCEAEQSESATAYELIYDEKEKKLEVKVHHCPFAWMQF